MRLLDRHDETKSMTLTPLFLGCRSKKCFRVLDHNVLYPRRSLPETQVPLAVLALQTSADQIE